MNEITTKTPPHAFKQFDWLLRVDPAYDKISRKFKDDPEAFADAWRAQEAKAGRYFDCGKRSVAGAFVHERHAITNLPRMAGWWGHHEKDRFMMKKGFIPMAGVDGWQIPTAAQEAPFPTTLVQ